MEKDFDKWNILKQNIELTNKPLKVFLQPRDVWMISFGRNIGFEQNGTGDNFSRPVLIVKKFNNQMFWVVPLTTRQKNLDFYYNFIDPSKRPVSAIMAQMRLISIKRCKRMLYRLNQNDFESILKKLADFLRI